VDIPESMMSTFTDLFHLLSISTKPFNKLLDWIISIKDRGRLQKLSIAEFDGLICQLMKVDNLSFIAKEGSLEYLPLNEWTLVLQ